MKELLENDFVHHYRKRAGMVSVTPCALNGTVPLYDSVACKQCIDFFRIHCPHETFIVNSDNDVFLVDHESLINNLQLPGDKCDTLLYDVDKIVLLDMTCSMEHYLDAHHSDGKTREGKRMKSRNQLSKSIERLCAVPTIAARIASYPHRDAILGYRVKDEELFRSVPVQIAKTERVWLALARQRELRNLSTPLSNGFSFKMVRYPKVYQW